MQTEIGSIVEGEVNGITKFGAFVTLPDGKSGMVHISEISSAFVKDINDILKVGQRVRVKIIGNNEGKISLSVRQAEAVKKEEKKPEKENKPKSFEDMMAAFKQQSDEKFSDLRRSGDSRYANNGKRGSTNRK